MLEKLSPARRNTALALIALVLGWFCWHVRAALNPLLLGLLGAYVLHPLVLRLERRGWTRKRAVNTIFVGWALLLTGIGVGLYLQSRALVRDVRERGLLEQIDQRLERGWDQARGKLVDLGLLEPEPSSEEGTPGAGTEPDELGVARLWREFSHWMESESGAERAGQAASGTLRFVRRLFDSILAFLGILLLVPLYTWFLLFELERIGRFARGLIPRQHRGRLGSIGDQVADMLGKFFHGRLAVCLLKGLILALVYALLGVPYAFLLGMLGGLLSLVPFVGPAVGYLAGFLLSLIAFEPSSALWRLGVVWALGEVIEGYVLMPKVLGESMGLHPVVVIAAFTIAGSALGMLGLIAALPLTATAIILVRELVLPGARAWAEEAPPGAGRSTS
jgi:predicted PurR-regulated permease PerM